MKKKLIQGILAVILCVAITTVAVPEDKSVVHAAGEEVDYHGIFDAAYYEANYSNSLPGTVSPEVLYDHYIRVGLQDAYSPSEEFQPIIYRENYPDLDAAFGDDWRMYAMHYVLLGKQEGRIADHSITVSDNTQDQAADGQETGGTTGDNAAQQETGGTASDNAAQQEGAGHHDATVSENAPTKMDYSTQPVIKLSTTTEADIQKGIAAAAPLIGERELVYSKVPQLITRTPRKLYYDGSIFTVCWQETINDHACYFAEVIVDDGMQFGRKLSGSGFGSGILSTASAMAKEVGAILASNADFYGTRPMGTVVTDGVVQRFDPRLDTCYVNDKGDLVLRYARSSSSAEEEQAFVTANNIRFGFTFGPIIMDNGKARTINSYMLGQIEENYSRAAIGQMGEHHYLIMNHSYWTGHGSGLLSDTISVMSQKGCEKAYTLDGGNTGEIVFDGEPFSRKADKERKVSDIIYFITARQDLGK